MKKIVLIAVLFFAFVTSTYAQNKLTWRQDGLKCTINLKTGDFSISLYDKNDNEYTIYGPNYDFEVDASSGSIYYYNSGKVSKIGSTNIYYYNSGKVSKIGSTDVYYYNSGKVSKIGSTDIYYYNSGKVSKIGSTDVYYYNSGKVSKIGGADIYYYNSGEVSSISGSVN